MRVLILTAQISPYHNARYVGAAKRFSDLHVLSTVNAGAFPGFVTESFGDYSVHKVFGSREEYEQSVKLGQLANVLWQKIAAINPDVIVAAGWTAPESLAALRYARMKKLPTVVMSESQSDDAHRQVLRELVKRIIVTQFDAALVGGYSHSKYIQKLGLTGDRVFLGYNAVDNEYFKAGAAKAREQHESVRRELGVPKKFILASARFIPKKNLLNLVSAYASARSLVLHAPDLIILGDGPEREAIQEAIEKFDLQSHVILPGFQGYDKLPALIGISQGFAHVSTSEQWGLVINEAMAAGVPVVASDRCGASRTMIVDGDSGILCSPDINSISYALVRLFEMSSVEQARLTLRAQEVIQNWGPDRFGVGLRDAVDRAVSLPRRGPLSAAMDLVLRRLERKVIGVVA